MGKQKGYLKQTNVWSTPCSGEGKGGKYLKMEKLGQEREKTGEGKGGKEKSDDGQAEFPLVDLTPSVAGDE